jgi:membrane-associated phospholipid phosphatase
VEVQGGGELVVAAGRAARLWWGLGSMAAVLFALTAILVSSSGRVAQVDEDVMASMSAVRQPVLTTIAQSVTDLGSYRPVTVFSLLLGLMIAYRTRRLLEPLVLLVAVEASSSLVELLKVVIDRERPPARGMLIEPVFDYSFPSGHAASGTVLFVLGALLVARTVTGSSGRGVLVAAGCVLSGLIGLSRTYLGYHWLTDVIGAWLLAMILTSIAMGFVTANQRPDSDTVHDAVAPHNIFSRLLVWGPPERNLT